MTKTVSFARIAEPINRDEVALERRRDAPSAVFIFVRCFVAIKYFAELG